MEPDDGEHNKCNKDEPINTIAINGAGESESERNAFENKDRTAATATDIFDPSNQNKPEDVDNIIMTEDQNNKTFGTFEESEQQVTGDICYYWDYKDVSSTRENLLVIGCSADEFSTTNILKGCKWAPDGSCLLTSSDDNILRLYNLPASLCNIEDWKAVEDSGDNFPSEDSNSTNFSNLKPALNVKEGGSVYDFCWFPLMNSADPATSCFISTAADNPVHLFDAFDGHLRGTYLTFNHLEQIVAPHAVAFDPTGNNIYCGFKNCIKIFDTTRPGKECTERKLKTSVLPDLNQHGIISCFAFNPCSTVYACGSFQKSVGLYLDDGTVVAILGGHSGGVTHLQFSQDGNKLFSGGRKDSRIICWDMRNLGDEYQIFDRVVETNQRIYFDISKNCRYLVSGNTNGFISVWDLLSTTESSEYKFRVSNDCVNGVSLNPFLPILAMSSGQRHFLDIAEDSDDEMFVKSESYLTQEHTVKLLKFL